MKSNLEKYLFELRRIEEHRTEGVEKKIRKVYKKVLKELKRFLGDLFIVYSEDGILDYSMLYRAGLDARFLDEVDLQLDKISAAERQEIRDLVRETYQKCYDGMRRAVEQSAGDMELVKESLASVEAVRPEVIASMVNNPVRGLTLVERLEKKRRDVIYNIRKDISVGLSNGDRYETIANRVAGTLEGDYKKAIRIVRTEAHRVREQGNHDCAVNIDRALKRGRSGMIMTKTWKTMKDERVRPNRRYKTKKGWKNGKPGKYDHQKMDGICIPVEEMFELPSGAKTMAPGQSGVAGEDINCRCYLSYKLKKSEDLSGKTIESTPDSGTIKEKTYEGIPKNWKKLEKADDSLGAVNPNYQKGEEYRNNCTNCVPAYELRKRGYDVIAKPSTKNHYLNHHPEAAWVNSEVIQASGSGLMDIIKAAEGWQDGARAEVVVIWKGKRNGHAFVAEKVKGSMEFYDVQSGKKYSKEVFEFVKENETKFWRIDNLELSDRGITACEAGGKNEI